MPTNIQIINVGGNKTLSHPTHLFGAASGQFRNYGIAMSIGEGESNQFVKTSIVPTGLITYADLLNYLNSMEEFVVGGIRQITFDLHQGNIRATATDTTRSLRVYSMSIDALRSVASAAAFVIAASSTAPTHDFVTTFVWEDRFVVANQTNSASYSSFSTNHVSIDLANCYCLFASLKGFVDIHETASNPAIAFTSAQPFQVDDFTISSIDSTAFTQTIQTASFWVDDFMISSHELQQGPQG